MVLDWADPEKLADYKNAPKEVGLYIIGCRRDANKQVTASADYDAYLGKWPDNFQGLYVGISENRKGGVRTRVSSHARKKGNKEIARRIRSGEELWFISISGKETIELEAVLLLLKTDTQFQCNVRDELERSARRRAKQRRRDMGEQQWAYYQNLDMGEHGEGM